MAAVKVIRRFPLKKVEKAAETPVKKQRTPAKKAGRGKLTFELAEKIRARYAEGGISMKKLGAEFGVSDAQVHHIVSGKQWTKER